ncbi:ThiF family adenylyltransferase [Roseiarcaceae bacterium H3SJ34-1]|uniref:ThiF family adenylyltransferase n=1 Tax=Terripilifer ovatus TaxID=3032367 RepID=UPI003AB99C08|nr:ThiF family adenylyltransferase [Roseiarcaceae bacterium H3SJ34-1]
MPDDRAMDGAGTAALVAAATQVEERLNQLGGAPQPLRSLDLARYSGRGFAYGWRLRIRFSDGDRQLDVLLPPGFPWLPPRIALVDPPPFLTWPHVETDGVLCLVSDSTSIDPERPADSVAYFIHLAHELIEKLIPGACDQDFKDEFLSYWGFAAEGSGETIISLVDPAPPSRNLRFWRAKRAYVVGDTDDAIQAWLANLHGAQPTEFKTATGLFIWSDAPLMPSDYPRSGRALRAVVERAGRDETARLDDLLITRPSKIVTVLGFNTANGPALAGTVTRPPVSSAHGARELLTKGFRPRAIPPDILASRYFGGGKVSLATVDRADKIWIHGRGQDARALRLFDATVAIVGCGSVGAAVAVALAQAGVGHLILIDFDTLKWANIGRHPLGAPHVEKRKAEALAKRLKADFPHISIDHHVADVGAVVETQPDILKGCDLIVSATGSWAAESRLDAWHDEIGRSRPIIYGWTEAHACAGHAVLIKGEGCLRCGFDGTGLPDLRVTTWPDGGAERQEPACGATYQPYGPVELGFINGLIAELCLDALLGAQLESVHRIWAGSYQRLARSGGDWTPEWRRIAHDRLAGGFIHEQPWTAIGCIRCQKAAAA